MTFDIWKIMGKINLIIVLIIILSANLFSNDSLNKVQTSTHKVIKTHLKNFKNNAQVTTISEYNDHGKILNFKYEYICGNIKDTYQSIYNYNQNDIFLTHLQNGVKIKEQKISVDDDGNFLENKTIYHQDINSYNDIYYYYKNKKLSSIKYTNACDKTKYDIENFYYEGNRIIKIIHTGKEYKSSRKLYEYNKREKIIKESWIFDNKVVREINFNYDSNLNLSSKEIIMFEDKKKSNGRSEYFYDNNGEIIKEINYTKDELESEINYLYY